MTDRKTETSRESGHENGGNSTRSGSDSSPKAVRCENCGKEPKVTRGSGDKLVIECQCNQETVWLDDGVSAEWGGYR